MMKTLLLSFVFALFANSAMAQLPEARSVAPGALATADVEFLRTADASNIDQITLGRRAASGTKNPGVRSLGDNVAKSHGKADDALRLLASAKNVELDHNMTERAKSEAEHLVTRDPAADRLYVEGVVRDGTDLIALYEAAMASQDADIRKFADTMLPALRDYKRQAEDILARESLGKD